MYTGTNQGNNSYDSTWYHQVNCIHTSLWLLSVIVISNGRTGPQYCRAQQLDSARDSVYVYMMYDV